MKREIAQYISRFTFQFSGWEMAGLIPGIGHTLSRLSSDYLADSRNRIDEVVSIVADSYFVSTSGSGGAAGAAAGAAG